MHRRLAVLFLALLVPGFAQSQPKRWVISPDHSAAYFTIKHLMITPIHGIFGQVRGEVWFDEAEPGNSKVSAVIPVAGACIGRPDAKERLLSKDFLWGESFPSMTFASAKVERTGEGKLMVTGELTLRGVSRQVVLDVDGPTPPVIDANGVPTRAVVGRTRLDRKDYGIAWNEALDGGGVRLADEVVVEIVLELVEPRRAAQAPGP